MTDAEFRAFIARARAWAQALLALMLLLTMEQRSAQGTDGCVPGAALVSQSKRRDLGHGYALYDEGYKNPPGHWEGIAQYLCLRLGDRPLAITETVSLSPSGKLLFFEDALAGTWVLGDAIAGRHVVVGKQDPDKIRNLEAIVWNEREGKVSVTYSNNLPPTVFDLNAVLRPPAASPSSATPLVQP